MRYIKTFEGYDGESVLIIVDVQKSFKKFFTEMYLNELNKYCKNFKEVYQIWDNHHLGKNVDKDYLYDEEHDDNSNNNDLYTFPNQVDLVEKRYNYDVDVDFYKKILSKEVYKEVKQKETDKQLKKGDFFKTTEGTIIVYIGNNHQWFHVPKKLYDIFITLKNKNVIIVGGADLECYRDIEISGKALCINVKRNTDYIYSATSCPIK